MMRIDAGTGDIVRHDLGNKIAGEATFIPRGTGGEDDGFLAIFAFDPRPAICCCSLPPTSTLIRSP